LLGEFSHFGGDVGGDMLMAATTENPNIIPYMPHDITPGACGDVEGREQRDQRE
jgi:hypothetical protein